MPEAAKDRDGAPFRYYALDRDAVQIERGKLAFVDPEGAPVTRAWHAKILEEAMSLLSKKAISAQPWSDAMIWSWYNWLPEYFFEAPASATHKYHPAWADRPDGLMLHSLAVCRAAASLSDLVPGLPERDYNNLIFAAWHHDMFKYGGIDRYAEGEMTVHEHPLLAGEFFKLPEVIRLMGTFGLSGDDCAAIADMISKHAGPYRVSRFSDIRLPECDTLMAKLLYKADYFASRKESHWVEGVLVPMPTDLYGED